MLKEILDFGNKIPVVKSIVPYVKDAASVIKKDVIPIVRNILDWLDKELSNVTGSGLVENTLKYIKNN